MVDVAKTKSLGEGIVGRTCHSEPHRYTQLALYHIMEALFFNVQRPFSAFCLLETQLTQLYCRSTAASSKVQFGDTRLASSPKAITPT